MSIGKGERFAVCAMLVVATVAGGGANASAEETVEPIAAGMTPMYVMDINEGQARKAGNLVERRDGHVILIDGSTGEEIARVPDKKNPTKGDVTTQGYVYGNCGYSYYYIYNYRSYDNVYHMETGFNVYGKAYDFAWRTGVDQPNGGYNSWSDYGPMWPDNNWDSGLIEEYSPYDGWHYGEVEYGAAYLTNGSVCYSGRPYDSEYVS